MKLRRREQRTRKLTAQVPIFVSFNWMLMEDRWRKRRSACRLARTAGGNLSLPTAQLAVCVRHKGLTSRTRGRAAPHFAAGSFRLC
jgi:hypothetical protein